MTPAALLLIVAVAAPMPPSVSATATPTECGRAALVITTDRYVEVEFGGDLGAMPPMGLRSTASVPLSGQPGTVIAWSVDDFRSDAVFASGTFTMPPCLSAPPMPTRPDIVTTEQPEVGYAIRLERRRMEFWNFIVQLVRGMW